MSQHRPSRRPLTYVLWTIQVLLALLFLFAGGMKLVTPLEQMAGPVNFPGPFLRFIGVVEVLGGLGLILPAALRIKPMLTPLAAAGLFIVMGGAVVVSFKAGGLALAAIPLVTGLLLAFVVWGRWKLVPIRGRAESPEQAAGFSVATEG